MAMRVTGMNSGLDTETIIQELVKAKKTKVDDAKKAQKKHEWKQDAWKELNNKLKNLQNKFINNMCFSSDYMKKTTRVSNSSIASVITGGGAVDCTQSLTVDRLARNAYLTGGKVANTDSSKGDVTALSTLKDLGFTGSGSIDLTVGGKTTSIQVEEGTTISDVLSQIKSTGLNASFDEKQQRFYISAKDPGASGDFTFGGNADALKVLGLVEGTDPDDQTLARKIKGEDAQITLNGATYTSSNNVFDINGLTITALDKGETSITTENDTDGIYDMLKNFLKEYNSVINEIDKLYNAGSAKGYEPLTSEEKEAMTEKEIEEWEKKIKDSVLRRDSNLSTVGNALKEIMASGFEVNGTTMHLSDFGIATLGYFSAADNEKYAYHIDGDPDDTNTSGNADKLKSMIKNDPDTVVSFFTQLSRSLQDKMKDLSKSVNGYRSYGSFYDDKKMKSDYDDYTSKIKDLEDKLTAYEDKWYAKFSAMETALAKMQSNANAVTSLLGGS